MFLRTAWDMCALDIEHTVKIICKRVLMDISAPWQVSEFVGVCGSDGFLLL